MKTIKILITLVLLLCTHLFSQNLWKPEKLINFTIQDNTKISSFVDANGIHILYYRNGGIKYALVNSQGDIIKYDKVIENDGAGTDFANVVAFDNNVYAVYYKNNVIQVARSTNLGDTWNNTFSYRPLENTGCNKILAYKDLTQNYIHITWAERRVGSTYLYDTHYLRFNTSTTSWTAYKRVSDLDTDGGENPDLALSTNRVHVNYLNYNGVPARNRDRLILWNNPENVPFHWFGFVNQVEGMRPIIIGNNLNTIYKAKSTPSNYFIGHSYKSVSSSTWYENESTLNTSEYNLGFSFAFVANNTADGKIHIIYWDDDLNYWTHRYITGTTFSSAVAQIPMSEKDGYNSLQSNSNDLYMLYANNFNTPGKISFRHYDANPLIPSNFAGSVHDLGYDAHPKVTWALSNEPDVRGNTIDGYIIERSLNYAAFSPCTTLSGDTNEFIDIGVHYAGSGPGTARYRIKSRDINDHESPWSNIVSINYGNVWKAGSEYEIINVTPENFYLSANYPNPFNPSTKINYALPEAANVQLRVYDMLGSEVAVLVNETKGAGYHLVDFDASNLSSGIYIYRITAANDEKLLFNETKRMILMK